MSYQPEIHPFDQPPELAKKDTAHVPVIIVGAGPVGLTLALDLARRGVLSIVLERGNTVGLGSKAICWAKRTLEIFDRLDCAGPMLEKGVTWNVGKVFLGADPEPVYSFDLLPETGHKAPAFINLQQYYVEEYLIDAVARESATEIRWQNRLNGVRAQTDGVVVEIDTPAGHYTLSCDYLIAADGSKSPTRGFLDLDFSGEVFQDHFLISDIRMKKDFPAERWFWFDPPFNPGRSALLHQQPDDVWRLDFQLGWDIDRERELQPDNVSRRVRAMLGEDVEFEFEWNSIYTFQCRQLDRFVHDRVIFIGDSAHLVSPFGARGANGGVQDADNLAWKLELVLAGHAASALLESYDSERVAAARENVLNSTRSTEYITPKSRVSKAYQAAALDLAREHKFARHFVNSGRLSSPKLLADSILNTPDKDSFADAMRPGSPCIDAPNTGAGKDDWLLNNLGNTFTGILFEDATEPSGIQELETEAIPVRTITLSQKNNDVLWNRYDARPGTYYLVRPDQHVAARWRRFDVHAVRRAVATATGNG